MWEYEYTTEMDIDKLHVKLDKFGLEGWECYHIMIVGEEDGRYPTFYGFLRRRK